MAAMTNIPIRRLTLYKHGVAFVERGGQVDAEEVALVFRADEVNDALKSLLVIDRAGGRPLGIHYATPADQAARLADIPIALSREHSLIDLLSSLRGTMVTLVYGDGTQRETATGRLLGVDLNESKQPLRDSRVALLDETSGSVLALPLASLREVTLVDERAQQDLRFLLDTSRSEAAHRTVTVRINPGMHDLAISYLVPSPTWRVSYRLVAETTPNAGDAGVEPAAGGQLLLQGWGLFDNRFEEDLEGVVVTLVAGQPISFVYDLASSRIPRRPVVEDAARVAAAPVEFAAMQPPVVAAAPGRMQRLSRSMEANVPTSMLAPPPPPATIQQLAEQPVTATGGDLGELFQYEVVAPVTVRRGESALVPILGAQLQYQRELLFNQGKLRDHPVAALRFTNTTGLVLERGPVTVLEDGAYRGEALVPLTRDGDDVYLACAVELGIKITVTTRQSYDTAGLRIAGGLLDLKQATTNHTTYRLENNLPAHQVVTIEHPVWTADAELVDTPPVAAHTAEFYRWTVECPPRQMTTFHVAERRYDWRTSNLLDAAYANLQEFLAKRWLDAPTLARIKDLLDERSAIGNNAAEINRLEGVRNELYNREDQLRKNMAALATGGDEGALRQQVVAQLRGCEQQINSLDERVAALRTDNGQRQVRIQERLSALSVPERTT